MRTRLSDYVIRTLEEHGVGHAFTVCGGGSSFLCDALAKAERMKYIATHHEQAAAMAAEGYARVRTGLGFALVTSGPGGTNAITGVAGAWTDHVPLVTISGQVFSNQTVNGHPGLRTKGVQELNIVPLVRPITKYAEQVHTPSVIRYCLERALHLARAGRPGPVWLDIPADVQNSMIDPSTLAGFEPVAVDEFGDPLAPDVARHVVSIAAEQVAELLRGSQRPLIHVGQGVRLAGAEEDLFELLDLLGSVPLLTARNANDIVASDHRLYIGRPGTFAQRGANFAVQSSDVYLAIGTRLSLAQTGYNAKDYARNAKVVMVDVDRAELDKDTVKIHLKVQADAKAFIRALIKELRGRVMPDWSPWLERCKRLQAKYPPVTEEQRAHKDSVNSYRLIEVLSEQLTPNDVVVTDMGFAFQNTHQAFRVKHGQRLMTNCGLAPMGWGLPAAIGAAVGSGRRVVCIVGDGGLMMNVQELATLAHHGLPVKVFVLNNGGYLTMRQSQTHAFDSYMGSDESSGLSFPDFQRLAAAHGIERMQAQHHGHLEFCVSATLKAHGPRICEVLMDRDQEQMPRSVNKRDSEGNMVQTTLEDAHPHLPREEIEENLCAR